MLIRPRIRCLWFDFEHGYFTLYGISVQQTESLWKCPFTLEIAELLPCLHAIVNSLYSYPTGKASERTSGRYRKYSVIMRHIGRHLSTVCQPGRNMNTEYLQYLNMNETLTLGLTSELWNGQLNAVFDCVLFIELSMTILVGFYYEH